MQLELTEDQKNFRDVVSRFMSDKSDPTEVRRLMETADGFDAQVWQQMCQEVGLAGTHIPEQFGGFGFGPVELGIVAEEMGRTLFCSPFFASAVMAGYALLALDNETIKESLLPGIADGSTIATLVLDNLNDPSEAGSKIQAEGEALSGSAGIVLDAGNADMLLVLVRQGNATSLYNVNNDAAGLTVTPLQSLDSTRKLFRVQFDATPAQHLGELSARNLQTLWDQMSVALAHEMIGGAQVLMDSTVDYTKIRYQFGRPIGSFQGLKHRCADQLMELELAKAAVTYASQALATGEGDPYASSMAKAMASDAYINTAKMAIQLRGGIGFTWEDDTHLWFKRAKSSEVFLGSPVVHRERMMQIIEEMGDA